MKKKDLHHQVTSFNDKIRLWTCHKHLSKNKIYARQTVINWKQILFRMNLKISMVSSDLWTEIDVRLSEIFSLSNALLFAGFSVVTIRNYLQLTPVRGRSIFSWFTGASRMNQLLSLQLWHLYKKMLNWQKLLHKLIRHLLLSWTVLASELSMKILRSFWKHNLHIFDRKMHGTYMQKIHQ